MSKKRRRVLDTTRKKAQSFVNKAAKRDCFDFSCVEYKRRKAIMVSFMNKRGYLLHVTREYNLIYVPETSEWFGDVIAYGQWWDLEADEVLQLREAYNLDAVVWDYLERGGEQETTYDYYAAAK